VPPLQALLALALVALASALALAIILARQGSLTSCRPLRR
jgi:hypothetical protein